MARGQQLNARQGGLELVIVLVSDGLAETLFLRLVVERLYIGTEATFRVRVRISNPNRGYAFKIPVFGETYGLYTTTYLQRLCALLDDNIMPLELCDLGTVNGQWRLLGNERGGGAEFIE